MQCIEELSMPRKRSVDPGAFKAAMADMPGAVTVITSWSSRQVPSGATLSAVVSLSLEPALILACFDHKSATLSAILSEGRFLMHVLAHGQQDLALHFSSKSRDKFKSIEWGVGMLGLPEIAGSVVTVGCELHQAIEAGDHKIVIGRVVEIERQREKNPIVYARRKLLPFDIEGAN